ncbi:MAG: hypothetical protein ACI4IJ_06875 [Acutalibacteraceae bacterium]|nr:hypothetical protein [Bacillota bacterium]
MQDMVKRIVEMDKHARELTDEAKRLKVGSEDRILAKKEELRRTYEEKVNARLELIRQAEVKTAEDELKLILEKQKKVEQNLNDLYAQNCDAWVDAIVARVIGDD